MSNHTPEPWVIAEKNKVRLDCAYIVRPVDDKNYEYGAALAATSQDDARRIVACVNACAGMRNDELEGGLLIGVMQAKIDRLEMQRDELLEALELSVKQMECDAMLISDEIGRGLSLDELEEIEELPEAIIKSRAAIAKAKGGAS